ncbi:hypothetical protein ACFVKB_01925 [Rhodococcus sp. NPDC127530]|uniref:hypothetical protein n=1 Tax=unclassified Rhodococcus (in: high G+C Gram-positive bacteria) TaxID=192944 RepID=UPI00363D0808
MSTPKDSYHDHYQALSAVEKTQAIRRFLAKRTVDAVPNPHTGTPCWWWTGATDRFGYARAYLNGRFVNAHRLAVVLTGRYDDPALVAHHECERGPDGCVNPGHIRMITDQENVRLGVSARQALTVECRNGHLLAGDDLIFTTAGHRRCRRCANAARMRSRVRTRLALEVAKYEAAVGRGESPDPVVIRMKSKTPAELPPVPAEFEPFGVFATTKESCA